MFTPIFSNVLFANSALDDWPLTMRHSQAISTPETLWRQGRRRRVGEGRKMATPLIKFAMWGGSNKGSWGLSVQEGHLNKSHSNSTQRCSFGHPCHWVEFQACDEYDMTSFQLQRTVDL